MVFRKRLKILLIAMFAIVLSACGEEDDQTVPLPTDVTEARLDSCVSGKGWILVSAREVKQNGTLAKVEYWAAADAGSPQQYFFNGDTLTTFMHTEAVHAGVYKRCQYTYKRLEHKLSGGGQEVFRLISCSPTELCVLQDKGFSGDGRRIYIYAVYRPMTAEELAACRQEHPFNLATINIDYPLLPEQTPVTLSDFKAKVPGHGWKCTGAFRLESDERYDAKDVLKTTNAAAPGNLYFTADTVVAFRTGLSSALLVDGRRKYTFRANSFSLDTGDGTGMRILALTADEMRLILSEGAPGGQKGSAVYCIYRKMTATEMASEHEDIMAGRSAEI